MDTTQATENANLEQRRKEAEEAARRSDDAYAAYRLASYGTYEEREAAWDAWQDAEALASALRGFR